MDIPNARNILVDFTISAERFTPDTGRIEALLDFAADREGLAGEVGIWLCTDDEIADLHLRFMDIPGATDVITFAGGEDTGGYLGDIAVSVDTASVQAKDAGHSPEREVAYLCLHGFLHIAGYDDLDDCARSRMLNRQETLLTEFEEAFPGEW
jgi:probable rRNA maturation factor